MKTPLQASLAAALALATVAGCASAPADDETGRDESSIATAPSPSPPPSSDDLAACKRILWRGFLPYEEHPWMDVPPLSPEGSACCVAILEDPCGEHNDLAWTCCGSPGFTVAGKCDYTKLLCGMW